MKASSESGECARTIGDSILTSVSPLRWYPEAARESERDAAPLVKKKMLASMKRLLLEFPQKKKTRRRELLHDAAFG